jgi:HTH-type transcriptional regulator / antitoxin HipB
MWIHTTKEFGELVRRKRKALGLTQEELATRCGVGVRFIVDLEAGKPSCQLGKALTVAAEVGLRLGDISNDRTSTELPKADEEGPLSQIPNFRTP